MVAAKEPTYPASFYARLFNISERRVQMLAKEGVIPKAARGKYPLIGSIQGYVRFLQDRRLSEATGEDDYRTHKVRLVKEQADQLELKNQMTRHEVAPFAFLTFVLAKAANGIAGVMDGMPSELVRRLALQPQQVDKVRAVTASASEAIAALGDEEWVAARYDEYLAEADQ